MTVRRAAGNGVVPRYMMLGDWPHVLGSVPCGRSDGTGPRYTDDKCEACGRLIRADGECGCSL